MKICVVAVDSLLLESSGSGGGMVKSGVQPEHRKGRCSPPNIQNLSTYVISNQNTNASSD